MRYVRLFAIASVIYIILFALLTADAKEKHSGQSFECLEAKYFSDNPLAFLDIEGCE